MKIKWEFIFFSPYLSWSTVWQEVEALLHLSEIAFFIMIYHNCPFLGPGWGPDFLALNSQLNEILYACSFIAFPRGLFSVFENEK